MPVTQEQLVKLFKRVFKTDSEEMLKTRFDTLVELFGLDFVSESYIKAKTCK